MAYLIETADDELKFTLGSLVWENTFLKNRVQELSESIKKYDSAERSQEQVVNESNNE